MPSSKAQDVKILRELAKRYTDLCAQPRQGELRDLWRRHNSLQPTRPLFIFKIMGDHFWSEFSGFELHCQDPLFSTQEMILQRNIFLAELGDDTVFEPWLEEWASYVLPPNGLWGLEIKTEHSGEAGGACKSEPAIQEWADAARMVKPHHEIDEKKTTARLAILREAVGDIIEVKEIRAPYYRGFRGDISTQIGMLRGIENMMLDMYEHPDELHATLKFMGESILSMHEAGDKNGDWRLCDHNNQAISYSTELQDPGAHSLPVPRKQLWCHMAAQEITLISPEMHEEFMLRYQRPIMEKFGLSAYGCCEDLTRKIDMLRSVKNLRRIAVTPSANLAKCAEQIGKDYVISWRPNPTDMVCYGWNPERVRKIISEGLASCRGQHIDITLKDVETVEHDPHRLKNWVRIVRECVEV